MDIPPLLQSAIYSADAFNWIMFCFFLLYIILSIYRFTRKTIKERLDKLAGPNPFSHDTDGLVYTGKNLRFSNIELDTILVKHFPYYRVLHPNLKKLFLQRLTIFIRNKIFIIRHSEGYKEMPVLLSAAAIQITFGLPHFKLPFYKYIQIHPEAYLAENSMRFLAGHVHGSTITVAWNHFYKNYQLADGINVGLHEMAHALYFQHLVADVVKKKKFVLQFEEVMEECQNVFDDCRETASLLYTKYAFNDLQEFWAESLELFFERPVQLKNLYPNLYADLSNLLQQDATNPDFPLTKKYNIRWEAFKISLQNFIR